MKIDIKSLKKYIVPAICIVVIVAGALGLYSWKESKSKVIPPEKMSEITLKFVNEKILQGQSEASVVGELVKESGVYKMKLNIAGQEYTSYVTADGKVFFPSGMEIPAEILAGDESNGSQQDTGIPKTDLSQALLFVMSFCPYGNQAEEAMMPVVNLLKDKADIQIHYVIYSNYNGGGSNYCLDKDNKYCSMHGIKELNQDVREICVQKYQSDKFWNFVKETNSKCTSQNVDTCWEGAASAAGVDIAKVKTCQKNEALTLLEQEVQLSSQYGVSGSPQLIINGTESNAARTSEGYKTAICSGFNNPPSECSQTLSGDSGTAPTGGCE
jgi:hypothetical protein